MNLVKAAHVPCALEGLSTTAPSADCKGMWCRACTLSAAAHLCCLRGGWRCAGCHRKEPPEGGALKRHPGPAVLCEGSPPVHAQHPARPGEGGKSASRRRVWRPLLSLCLRHAPGRQSCSLHALVVVLRKSATAMMPSLVYSRRHICGNELSPAAMR